VWEVEERGWRNIDEQRREGQREASNRVQKEDVLIKKMIAF
jgi:hypothetical protein